MNLSRPGSPTRRDFLVASTSGIAGFRFGTSMLGAAGSSNSATPSSPAKTTILFFLCGGSSHVDMWDVKPDAPSEYRSLFRPIRTTAPEIQLCEHLPMTAKVADKLAIVRTVTDYGRATGDHHAGYYYNLTGHVPDITFRQQGNDRRPYPDDWPFINPARKYIHTLAYLICLPVKYFMIRLGCFWMLCINEEMLALSSATVSGIFSELTFFFRSRFRYSSALSSGE